MNTSIDSSQPAGHRSPFRPEAALLIFLLSASSVFAHTRGATGGFVTGFSHPISGWDHVLAMVAVGLWGAQLGHPEVWLLPIAFPLMMACGATLGLIGLPLPGVEVGIAVSAIVLGLLVMLEGRPGVGISLAVVAFFAVFHGHAHGTELPPDQSGLLYSIGFVICTGLLHGLGIGVGTVHRWKAGRLALRIAGGAVFAGGLFFLARSMGGSL